MEFTQLTERRECIFIPVVWKDKTSNPQKFFDKDGKVISFIEHKEMVAFLKKNRPFLCTVGIKRFPRVGYVKAISKTEYKVLK